MENKEKEEMWWKVGLYRGWGLCTWSIGSRKWIVANYRNLKVDTYLQQIIFNILALPLLLGKTILVALTWLDSLMNNFKTKWRLFLRNLSSLIYRSIFPNLVCPVWTISSMTGAPVPAGIKALQSVTCVWPQPCDIWLQPFSTDRPWLKWPHLTTDQTQWGYEWRLIRGGLLSLSCSEQRIWMGLLPKVTSRAWDLSAWLGEWLHILGYPSKTSRILK